MKIIYKCRCMKVERFIDVTDRVNDSDIGDWMESVVSPSISYDHRNRHPLCQRDRMEYVKIPTTEGLPIGTQPTRN